ncbi:hypothetical protein KDA23_00685 [Candidatus Saccharibacteria bacterium]|nr:hypothetical protein [Candidatus Saccharibacteria bacterium]
MYLSELRQVTVRLRDNWRYHRQERKVINRDWRREAWRKFRSPPESVWIWNWLQWLVVVPTVATVGFISFTPVLLWNQETYVSLSDDSFSYWSVWAIYAAVLLFLGFIASLTVLDVSNYVRDRRQYRPAKKAQPRPRPSVRCKPGKHRLEKRKRFRP